MKKQVFGTSHVPLSPAVRAGDFVYVSGQVPVDGQGNIVTGDIKAQTRQVLENIKSALALAGATLDDVVKTMWNTAMEMNTKFKETAEGGLATNVPISLSEC